MKHARSEYIKAWSMGIPIQHFDGDTWETIDPRNYYWREDSEVRYKPKEPELISYYSTVYMDTRLNLNVSTNKEPNLELIFDKDLGTLIDAKVLNETYKR